MGQRDREIDAGAPETGRDCGTAGQRVIWEMLTQRGRHRARERLRDQVVPQHPHPLPQTQQTRAAPSLLPGCARPRTMHPCPGSSRGSWRVGPGPGGRGSQQEAGLWPLPSDSPCSPWPPFQVSAYSQHVWSTCCVYLKCPLASPGILSSPLSLPVPSACSSCASDSLLWRKWSFIKFLVFVKQFPHTASAPHTVPSTLIPFTSS